jgi:hypothetical protein
MIIIKIVGGLASQLHKYAIGRALSLKHNTELKLDISWFDNIPCSDTIREYQLDKYNIVATIATEQEIKHFKPNKYLIKVNNKIRKYTNQEINFRNYCNESFISLENFNSLPNDIYIEGEWSGFKYFENIKDILINELSLKSEYISNIFLKYQNIIQNNQSISLHVRRGDYVNNIYASNLHIVCSIKYYEEAIKYFEDKVEKLTLLIFSDDLEWVKTNIRISKDIQHFYVENTKDFEEFQLLMECQYNIISNSGFSWFSSWLNKNQNKIVISPVTWIKNKELNEKFIKTMADEFTIFMDNYK